MNEPDKTRRNVAASVRARLLNKARGPINSTSTCC